MRSRWLAVLVPAVAFVVSSPATSTAASYKSCQNVTLTITEVPVTYLGVKATGLSCSTARAFLKKAGQSGKIPAGWTYGDTKATYDPATDTATCGNFYKHGRKRIVFHLTKSGAGCR